MIERLLQVWFGELDDGYADSAHRRRWFAFDAEFDQAIRDEFSAPLARAAADELIEWRRKPRGCLAYIILTDQFSRQIHRGTAQAFATDALALAAARDGIARDFDKSLAIDERTFFYMPFEHSEQLDDQNTVVRLYRMLSDAAAPSRRAMLDRNVRFAEQHRDIIRRFHRFPHRNDVLGRDSTVAERAYLAHAKRFGQ
jgi:uncharacterized protein (DUF924 family)